ncbi:MAG TPA: TIGR03435 family protein [Acidobacteriaceae bacterium]
MILSVCSTAKLCGAIAIAGIALATSAPGRMAINLQDTADKPVTFDVTSIKPSRLGNGDALWRTTPDGFSTSGTTVQALILGAYDLKRPEQIVGLPAWASTEKFDIEAKVDADTTVSLQRMSSEERRKQQELRMQSMLADRFGLKIHHESKLLSVYDLIVAKGGIKMKASPADAHASLQMGRGQFFGRGVPIDSLVFTLSNEVGRDVVDKTNLTGKYQIDLKWVPDELQEQPQPKAGSDLGLSIFTALKEQLGLKLEPAKGPVGVVVVDRIERPADD